MEEQDKQKMEELVKSESDSWEKHFKIVLPKDEYDRGLLLIQTVIKTGYMNGFAEGMLKVINSDKFFTPTT